MTASTATTGQPTPKQDPQAARMIDPRGHRFGAALAVVILVAARRGNHDRPPCHPDLRRREPDARRAVDNPWSLPHRCAVAAAGFEGYPSDGGGR